MLTYLEIFKALPPIGEQRAPTLIRCIPPLLMSCLALAGVLLAWAWHTNDRFPAYAALVPLALMLVAVAVELFVDIREAKRLAGDRKLWGLVQLDQRVVQEQSVAPELAKLELAELKWMAQRLEAEALVRERWTEVLKPFSMLAPAALIVVTVDVLHLPAIVQDLGKVLGAAVLIGTTVGVISIYESIVPLRRLAAAVHYAIVTIEKRQKPVFRKVSRKRCRK